MEKKTQFLLPNKLSATALPSKLTASATGNPRNKVALKPGKSLLDWIKLTHREKDLPGTGGKIIAVTAEELRRHDKPGDLWIAIRGNVYNVSAYLDFHPGGEEELMKGAGKDATKLFNDVHPWVNYDTMLKKCLVGPFKSGAMLQNPLGSEVTLPGSIQPVKHGTPKPTFTQEWTQSSTSVTIAVKCKNKKLSRHCLVVDILDCVLRAVVRVSGWVYLVHVKLFADVEPELDVHVSPDGSRLDLIILKKDAGDWDSLGETLPGHGVTSEADEARPSSRVGLLVYKEDVTHDTRLFCIKLEDNTRLGVPIGQHVELRIKEEDLGRFYTPVDPALSAEPLDLSPNLIYFLIKIYSRGKLTALLDRIPEGGSIEVSDPAGSFDCQWLDQWDQLLLVAGGTGITPMIRVINYVLKKMRSKDVRLLLFNKTEKDIPWKEPLESLSSQIDKFRVSLVLSEASDGWAGPTGRVRASLIKSHASTGSKQLGVLVCGSTGFNSASLKAVQECGVSEKQVYIFSG